MRHTPLLSSPLVLLLALGCSASGESPTDGFPRPTATVPGVGPVGTAPGVTPGVSPVAVNPGSTDGVITTPVGSGNVLAPGEIPAGCGDGIVSETEACDDANNANADGCTGNCLQLEPGFSCSIPGQACLKVAVCGDGLVASSEQCDDQNRLSGDGCSDKCKFELGKKCEGEPSVCLDTVCGDNMKEGAESCDDGNNQPFDGCSEVCITEPTCTGGACTSACGDGLIINEACDDGNQIAGDGCSATCTIEPGFMCQPIERPCEMVGGACVFNVPVIYRDHPDSHPDFGARMGIECEKTLPEDEGGETVPDNVLTKGMVQDSLGPTGRPVLLDGNQDCSNNADKPSYLGVEQFDNWFTDGPHVVTVAGTLTLFDNEDGGYVNRYTAEGDKFVGYEEDSEEYDDAGDLLCSWCFDGDCEDPCSAEDAEFDGSPLFFPVDDVTGPTADMGPAKIPAEYGFSGWPFEEDWGNELNQDYEDEHNFYFTTEVKTWFKYTADLDATLDFTGDDDVWVFVNGKLAVDLGGIHAPEDGTLTLNAASATKFGLAADQVYELTVFQAERRMEGSSFRLTLSGFENTPSECGALCGDGVVAFGEECDRGEGMNVGGYGGCTAECRLGEFCGDAVVNGAEQCDPGLGNVDPECTNCQRKRIVFL